ncbi:MAG: hypothetical protein LUD68_09040 [Rikenellaceae bacterium]|nr:hypothetical protein [Rikenellaceae bacterium]
MTVLRYDSDRVVDSTENNEYAEGYRDEIIAGESMVGEDIPTSDFIPDGLNEDGMYDRSALR